MFIDTHTKGSMVASVCKALKISKVNLIDALYIIDKIAKNGNKRDEMIETFIDERLVCPPDEILLFHISRRVNGREDDVEGKNLAELLTTENAFSEIIKKVDIQFIKGEHHIDVLYKGQIVDWDKCCDEISIYMKRRLGYFDGEEDYCFNGFAFRDLLYKNDYAKSLFDSPEFLGKLNKCLDCKDLDKYYMENSAYYFYEYKIPIKYVMIDDYATYTYEQKQKYLIKCTLLRISKYLTCDERDMNDDNNPILRLADNFTLSAEYFVSREEIPKEMIF